MRRFELEESDNFFHAIKNEGESDKTHIFLSSRKSDQYMDSPACINEMGATWGVYRDYTNIYVTHFSFGNPKYHECAVDTRKMGAVLSGDKQCK